MLPEEVCNDGEDISADRHYSWRGEISSSAANLKQRERTGGEARLYTLKAAPGDTCLPVGSHLVKEYTSSNSATSQRPRAQIREQLGHFSCKLQHCPSKAPTVPLSSTKRAFKLVNHLALWGLRLILSLSLVPRYTWLLLTCLPLLVLTECLFFFSRIKPSQEGDVPFIPM